MATTMTDELSKNPIVKEKPGGRLKLEIKGHVFKMEVWIRKPVGMEVKIDTDVVDTEGIKQIFRDFLERLEQDD